MRTRSDRPRRDGRHLQLVRGVDDDVPDPRPAPVPGLRARASAEPALQRRVDRDRARDGHRHGHRDPRLDRAGDDIRGGHRRAVRAVRRPGLHRAHGLRLAVHVQVVQPCVLLRTCADTELTAAAEYYSQCL
jgi:hypothetical protein